MKTQSWKRLLSLVAVAALAGLPYSAMAADNDLDGIDDAQETGTPVTPLVFNGVTYSPCTAGMARNSCLSPTSKDIFIYLVTAPGGGFLGANNLLAPEFLFKFITDPNVTVPDATVNTGKVDGLGVGVHVAFVTAEVLSSNRGVGTLGEKAVQIISDDDPNAFVFGAADVGTPTATGDARVWPVKIRNYVVNGGGTTADWQKFIQRTYSHELSHVAALTATNDSRYGGYHYATGSGVVMDQNVVFNSKRKTFTIYDNYASGDRPCLLKVTPVTNPLTCVPLDPVIIVN